MKIKINNKEYNVKEANTESEKEKGLQGVTELKEDEGMLFYFDPPQDVSMWMKDTKIPLDIIFIDEDQEVISIKRGNPESEKAITESDVAYVLELNAKSGVKVGNILEFENDPVMKVLGSNGESQYELWGGERIFSRANTKILIKKAKKANETQSEGDLKALGRYMFKCLKGQDDRDPEYVSVS